MLMLSLANTLLSDGQHQLFLKVGLLPNLGCRASPIDTEAHQQGLHSLKQAWKWTIARWIPLDNHFPLQLGGFPVPGSFQGVSELNWDENVKKWLCQHPPIWMVLWH